MFRPQMSDLFERRFRTGKVSRRDENVRQTVQSRDTKLTVVPRATKGRLRQPPRRRQVPNSVQDVRLVDDSSES
jgi:hypothetical protein